MLIIIDANVTTEFFPLTEDAKPVLEAILKGSITCVSGQRHKAEMLRCKFRTLYRAFLISGKLREYPSDAIDVEERRLPSGMKSDDPHILALARVSRARVLFSRDVNLHNDFVNPRFINDPRGKIYQKNPDHLRLLSRSDCA